MVLWQAGHRGPTMLQAGKTVSRRFSRLACWRHIPQAPSWQNCVLRLRAVRRFLRFPVFKIGWRAGRDDGDGGWGSGVYRRGRCDGEPAGVRIVVATVAIVAQYVISLIRRNAGNARTVCACPRALADFRR